MAEIAILVPLLFEVLGLGNGGKGVLRGSYPCALLLVKGAEGCASAEPGDILTEDIHQVGLGNVICVVTGMDMIDIPAAGSTKPQCEGIVKAPPI